VTGRFLAGRAAPALFGLASSLLYGWIWGSLDGVPTVHDEAAYVLQAKLFAAGEWTAPPPPFPEFFEQIHVFVTPFLASKYPPGHSIALTPGIWLGLPGLMSIVLSGVAGALVFLLARRLANPWVALAAWFVWTSAPGDLFFRASYMSEMTTTALLLAAWWALLEWRRTLSAGWLLAVAGCMAWSAITRPFSTLALLLPIGAVVLWTAWKRSRWRDVLLAAALGGAVLFLVPIWSAATTGDWRTTPYAL
jgi:4-amino-4-deoxy-L-arabinose transferase-like glycosyltransferase